jgi:hypothetical protein
MAFQSASNGRALSQMAFNSLPGVAGDAYQ